MRQISKKTKEMQGTYEPSKETDSIRLQEWDASKMPAAPTGWPPGIQRLWNDRCKDLYAAGYLAAAFLPLLRRYCFAIMQAEEAEKHLLDEGFTTIEIGTKGQQYEVMSKWINVLDNANKTIERIGTKFGFSPLDVQKIPAIEKKKGNERSLIKLA